MSLSISGCFLFFIYKHRALIGQLAKDGYSFNTSAVVMVKIDAPVSVNAPVKQNFKIPFKEIVHIKAPVKTKIPVHIDKIFSIQTNNPIRITIDHKFPINEMIRIDTIFPVNSKIDATVFGMTKRIAINGDLPIKWDVPLSQEVRLNDTFSFLLDNTIDVSIDDIFDIPIDTYIECDVPVDLNISIPFETTLNADILVEDEIPVLLDFDFIFHLFKGIEVKGIKLKQKKMSTIKEGN